MMVQRSGIQEKLFYSFSLEEYVPGDHLLRRIDQFLDLSDLREHLAGFYGNTGRPSAAGDPSPSVIDISAMPLLVALIRLLQVVARRGEVVTL